MCTSSIIPTRFLIASPCKLPASRLAPCTHPRKRAGRGKNPFLFAMLFEKNIEIFSDPNPSVLCVFSICPPRFRAWTGGSREAGSTQGDAIREIYGAFTRPLAPSDAGAAGTFSSITRANYLFQRAQGESMAEVEFKASRVVQTAEENRPVNIALPVILYLGEKS